MNRVVAVPRQTLFVPSLAPAIPGFNQEKCTQRRRVEAARFHASGFPVQLRGATPAEFNDGFTVAKSAGWLATSPDMAVKRINSKLPSGAQPLTVDNVHLLTLEAANSRFIPSYSEYLGESTLRNFAADGAAGVSFMNSHRTGRMSAPAELPFGQSYSGAYQVGVSKDGLPMQRTLIGVYMLRGIQPNGANGPSTDALYQMAMGGMIRDVSVGFIGGTEVCDVCGNVMDPYDDSAWSEPDENGYRSLLCRHLPGTTRRMTGDEIASQKARDPLNKKGVATYTVQDGGLSEVSAVYDGAVPGAGIRQIMALMQSPELSPGDKADMLSEAYDLWGDVVPFDLLQQTLDNSIGEVTDMWRLPAIGGSRQRAANNNPAPPANPQPGQPAPVAVPALVSAADYQALQQQLAAANAQLQQAQGAQQLATATAQNTQLDAFMARVRANINPAAADRVADLFEAAQTMDGLQLTAEDGSMLSLERHVYSERGERLDATEPVTLAQLVQDAFAALGQHAALAPVPVAALNPNGARVAARQAAAAPRALPNVLPAGVLPHATIPGAAVIQPHSALQQTGLPGIPPLYNPGYNPQPGAVVQNGYGLNAPVNGSQPLHAAQPAGTDEVDADFVQRATQNSALGRTGQVMLANRAAMAGRPNTKSGDWIPGAG